MNCYTRKLVSYTSICICLLALSVRTGWLAYGGIIDEPFTQRTRRYMTDIGVCVAMNHLRTTKWQVQCVDASHKRACICCRRPVPVSRVASFASGGIDWRSVETRLTCPTRRASGSSRACKRLFARQSFGQLPAVLRRCTAAEFASDGRSSAADTDQRRLLLLLLLLQGPSCWLQPIQACVLGFTRPARFTTIDPHGPPAAPS